jgi:hypothetical protein
VGQSGGIAATRNGLLYAKSVIATALEEHTMTPSRMLVVLLLTALSSRAEFPGLVVAALVQDKPAQSPSPSNQPNLHTDTLKLLHGFLAAARQNDMKDEIILKALKELHRQVKDENLATVESFALTEEAKPVAWALAGFLVERKRYDGAADVIVTRLVSTKDNRQYAMWKWWEHNFEEREDYKNITRQITDSLLRQFAKGSADRKRVVAELFGKGAAEAKLSAEEFKRAIKYKGKE